MAVTERDRDILNRIVNLYVRDPHSYWIKALSALKAYRESCVAEEREACAMLHESVPNECDRDLHRLTVTGCGCGAMGAVIAYRDAIRERGQRG